MSITSNTTLTEDNQGAVIINADNLTLDCAGHAVLGPGPTGITVYARSHVTVRNCRVSGFNSGIILQQSQSILVTGNTVSDNTGVGIGSYSVTGSMFSGNVVSGNTMGLYVTPTGLPEQPSAQNTFRNNTASGNRMYGFAFIDLQDSDVVANTSSGNASDGFAAWAWKTALSSNRFVANRSDGNGGSGFGLANVSGNVLAQNSATNNRVIGFWVSGSTGNTLTGNTARGNAMEGFEFANAASSNVLEQNVSTGNGQDGFQLLGLSGGNRLVGNVAVNNDGYGFGSYGAKGNIFLVNRASRNKVGFALRYGAAQNSLGGNVALANDIGFLVEQGSTGNVLTLNIGQGNAVFDAWDGNLPGANSWHSDIFTTTNPPRLGLGR